MCAMQDRTTTSSQVSRLAFRKTPVDTDDQFSSQLNPGLSTRVQDSETFGTCTNKLPHRERPDQSLRFSQRRKPREYHCIPQCHQVYVRGLILEECNLPITRGASSVFSAILIALPKLECASTWLLASVAQRFAELTCSLSQKFR